MCLAWSLNECVVAAAALSLGSGAVCFVLTLVTEGDSFCPHGSIYWLKDEVIHATKLTSSAGSVATVNIEQILL